MSPVDANNYYNMNFSTMPNVSSSQLEGFYNASLANSIFTNQVYTQQQMSTNNFKSSMSNMMQMMMMMKMMDTMGGTSSSGSSLKAGKSATVTMNGNITNYKIISVNKDTNGAILSIELEDKDTGVTRTLTKDTTSEATNRYTDGTTSYALNGTSFAERQANLVKGYSCDISLNGAMSTYTVVSADNSAIKLKDANGKTITLKSTGAGSYTYNDITYKYAGNSLLVAETETVGYNPGD